MRSYLALAGAAVLIGGCASEKSGNGKADSTPAATTVAAVPQVITITAKDFSFNAPDTVQGGMVTIKLVNQGPELHHIQLLRLTDGKTVADLEQGLKAAKPDSPPPPWAHDVAGPNAPIPGGEVSITEQLEPGTYAIVCFIPGADNIPHVMKGMIRALTVVPATAAAAPAPTSDISVVMSDYSWAVTPEITTGKHTIKIENSAEQSHEMLLVQLPPGKTVADLAAWVGKQVGPPPAKPMGGISGMPKGAVVYLPVDLEPGEYGLLCFLNDAKDGKMHVEHGMMKQFTVK
ncbi:MAG: hypothetical protein ABJB74_22725 [Gemmatimonas sp.]